MKPGKSAGAPIPLKSTRLLDQVRERIQDFHDSLSTETTDVHWVRFFVYEMGTRELHGTASSLDVLAALT